MARSHRSLDRIRSLQAGECCRLVVVGRVTSHALGTDRAFLLVVNQNAARHRYQRTADRQLAAAMKYAVDASLPAVYPEPLG